MEKLDVTIADVAKLARVSKMSVSRVLNGQTGVSETTRQRILQAVTSLAMCPMLAFAPASRLAVALLIPNIMTPYMGEILRGVSGAANG